MKFKIKNNKIIIVAAIMLLIIVLVCVIFIYKTNDESNQKPTNIDANSATNLQTEGIYTTVAEINGVPVALDELQMFVDEERELTFSYFKSKFNLDTITNEQWHDDFEGETPVEYAINMAIKKLIPYKITQQELLNYGILDDISYESFIKKLEIENADRKKKKESGGIIYGPIQYSKRIYYNYLNDQYNITLQGLLQKKPEESDLKKIYNDNPDMFNSIGSVTMQCIILPQSDFSKEKADSSLEEFKYSLATGSTFEEAATAAAIFDYSQQRTFTAEDLRTPEVTEFENISDAIYNLQPGQTTEIIENGDIEYIILYSESREGSSRRSFEDCTLELTSIFNEQYFAWKFEEMIESAQINIYQKAQLLIK